MKVFMIIFISFLWLALCFYGGNKGGGLIGVIFGIIIMVKIIPKIIKGEEIEEEFSQSEQDRL